MTDLRSLPVEDLFNLLATAVWSEQVDSGHSVEPLRVWPDPVPEMLAFIEARWVGDQVMATYEEWQARSH